MFPGNMMKPEQEIFGAGFHFFKLSSYFRCILGKGITAIYSPVKAYPDGISAVIINRVPVGPSCIAHPRSRTVMVAGAHDVVQAKWGHIVHQVLVGGQHDLLYRNKKLFIVGETLPDPFFSQLA